MKKVRVLIILFVMFMVVPCTVNAETIADYRARIKAIEKEKAEKEKQSAEVQGRIDAANKRINEISVQIVQGRKEQENTQKEIERLDNEISIKDEEIKDLVAFYQISSSDNFYLKYIFGADSFEDFIYRFSVAEQLTDANDKLVDEMNALIKENEIKVKELKAQEVKLNALDNEIKAELEKLGDKKRELTENTLSADEEIATIEKQIAFFKKEGCKEDQDVNTCSLNAPSVHGFVLPTATGVVGKVTMVTDPTGTGLIPWGNMGLAAEQAAKKWAPYKRMTDASGRVYQRTVSRAVRRIPSVPEMAIGAQNLGHMVGM